MIAVSALTRKLLREIWQHRSQMASIAAVVATGIMTVLTMRGAYESLVTARDRYYRTSRFPDVWAQLERAPESLVRRIARIPGVTAVDTRVTFTATLDVPAVDAPALGRFVSIPERRVPTLGAIHLRTGRYIEAGRRDEVIISENFAEANGFRPGDTLRAIINGRFRELRIVGTAISPEHLYAVPPGSLFPENERYGIVWMGRDTLGPAFDMEGAFNEVALTISPGTNVRAVIEALDRLLEPYGGLGAYGRDLQPSHMMLQGELDQNRTLGTAIPAVFLGVAAFLLNIVLGRLIATQRGEIAVLKAFGYSNTEIGFHYLQFAMAAVGAGAITGVLAGVWLGAQMVDIYRQFFDFPDLYYIVSPRLVMVAATVSMAAAFAGALGAVRRATRLPPAEAMRPEPPATFEPGVFERMGIGRALPASGRMILRNLERRPFRSAFSAIGVAFSTAILVIGLFMFDAIRHIMHVQFGMAQREDVSLTFYQPLSASVRHDLGHLEGVMRVEPFRVVAVRLRAGHRERETSITGLEPGSRLRQIVSMNGRVQRLPATGLVLSAMLARQLGVEAGDRVIVEVLEGERAVKGVTVAGIVDDLFGLSAYMPLEALHALARGGRAITGANLTVAESARSALNARLKELPVVAGVSSPSQALQAFEKQLSGTLYISVSFLLGFSMVIAVAVVYNGARIALSERGRELASLRVLGFYRSEVAVLLLGEQGLLTLAAIPLGWIVGYALSTALVASLATEAYRIPLVISTRTYLWSALITIAAAVMSGLIVRRRLDQLDLVAVLKTRE